MKNQQKSGHVLPSDQEILDKKPDFKVFAEQVAAGLIKVQRKETITDKLGLVSEELSLIKNLPYSALVNILKERLGLTVGEDTLRIYCQSQLGFPSKSNKRKSQL